MSELSADMAEVVRLLKSMQRDAPSAPSAPAPTGDEPPPSAPVTDADVVTWQGPDGLLHARRADRHHICAACDGHGATFGIDAEGRSYAADCWCSRLDGAVARLNAARIPGQFATATWERTVWHPGLAAARAALEPYYQPGEAMRWGMLLVAEGTGLGKSRIAAMALRYAALKGRAVRWVSWEDLLGMVSAAYASRRSSGAGELDGGMEYTSRLGVITAHTRPRLLVVDDIRAAGAFGEQIADQLVDARWRAGLGTIITSNHGVDGLDDAIGARARSRLAHRSRIVEVGGDHDWRMGRPAMGARS